MKAAQLQLPLVDGEPWFYSVDICRALDIANSRDAVSKLDDDDVGKTDGVDSLGKRAVFTVVNESGLYNLVFQSRKPEAKKFKRWITREVIPQLRKAGVYSFGRPSHPCKPVAQLAMLALLLAASLMLEWQPNYTSDQVTHYRVWHSTDLFDWQVIGQTNGTSYPLGEPLPGKHFYFVTAVNAYGESDWP